MTAPQIVTVAGKTYSTRDCAHCGGTGHSFDATSADKVNAGPFAGTCSGCRSGKIWTFMPSIEIAEGIAHETNNLMIHRATQPVGEIPDWAC